MENDTPTGTVANQLKGNEADSKATRIGAKRPKGVGEFFPRAPLGLSRRDWGLKV